MTVFDDPRVEPDTYIVKHPLWDKIPEDERSHWQVAVVNGHAWGWSCRRGHANSDFAYNREGKQIIESRGSKANKARRWPLEEALEIALKISENMTLMGRKPEDLYDELKES